MKSKSYQLQKWRKVLNQYGGKEIKSTANYLRLDWKVIYILQDSFGFFFLCHYYSVGEQRVNLNVCAGKSNKALSAELAV